MRSGLCQCSGLRVFVNVDGFASPNSNPGKGIHENAGLVGLGRRMYIKLGFAKARCRLQCGHMSQVTASITTVNTSANVFHLLVRVRGLSNQDTGFFTTNLPFSLGEIRVFNPVLSGIFGSLF